MRLNRILLALSVPALLVACSDGGGEASPSTAPATPEATAPVTTAAVTTVPETTAAAEPLLILVTNDDGIEADGLTTLVHGLEQIPDVEVVVVAPAENQSGSSDKTTEGEIVHTDVTTAAGIAGVAVQGFPADTVNVAVDELGIEPDLVVSGINFGQNASFAVPLSGTVGAARTAARRGIPAIAVSGSLEGVDFEIAAQLAVDEVTTHIAEYGFGMNTERTVVNINLPVCSAGEVRGIVDVPVAYEAIDGADFFSPIDCTSTETDPANDALALVMGYASRSIVPADL